MGLPVGSTLEPEARAAAEARLRRCIALLREGRATVRHPVGGLIGSGALGLLKALAKHGLLIVGGAESALRARRARATLQLCVLGAEIPVRLAVASLFLGLGKLLSSAQTALALEAEGRMLSVDEQAILRGVFGAALDLRPLRIKPGRCGLAGLTTRPFVHAEVLYLKQWSLTPALLVHEAVHFWQNEWGGPDYMLDSLWSQAFGPGYDWERSVPECGWENLQTEQQARLIEDAFRAGYFERGRFFWNGRDLTAYMDEAVASMRAGRGAP